MPRRRGGRARHGSCTGAWDRHPAIGAPKRWPWRRGMENLAAPPIQTTCGLNDAISWPKGTEDHTQPARRVACPFGEARCAEHVPEGARRRGTSSFLYFRRDTSGSMPAAAIALPRGRHQGPASGKGLSVVVPATPNTRRRQGPRRPGFAPRGEPRHAAGQGRDDAMGVEQASPARRHGFHEALLPGGGRRHHQGHAAERGAHPLAPAFGRNPVEGVAAEHLCPWQGAADRADAGSRHRLARPKCYRGGHSAAQARRGRDDRARPQRVCVPTTENGRRLRRGGAPRSARRGAQHAALLGASDPDRPVTVPGAVLEAAKAARRPSWAAAAKLLGPAA